MKRLSLPHSNSRMCLKLAMCNGVIIGLFGWVDDGDFPTTFLDRFFPREMRDAKVVEFIKFLLGGMSVREYSLKFSKYAPSLVSDPRD